MTSESKESFEVFSNPPLKFIEFRIWWHVDNMEAIARSESFINNLTKAISDRYDSIGLGQTIPEHNPALRPFKAYELSDPKYSAFKIKLCNEYVAFRHYTDDYSWEKFYNKISGTFVDIISSLTSSFASIDHIHMLLEYNNFIEMEPEDDKQVFIKDNFNVELNFPNKEQKRIKQVSLSYMHDYENQGTLQYTFYSEKHKTKDGITLFLNMDSKKEELSEENMKAWAKNARNICHAKFKELCSKDLLNKFNNGRIS